MGDLMITVLTGENDVLRTSEAGRLYAEFEAAYGAMAIERFDCEETEVARIRLALESVPFLAQRKLVVLRAPSANKQFVEQAESILANISDDIDVLIIEPKLDKRSAYYKFLKKLPEFRELAKLDERELIAWLNGRAKQYGVTLGASEACYLVERVGGDQQLAAQELDKLSNYDQVITRQTIDLLVEPLPQSSVFDLLEAAFAGQSKRVLELYDEQRALKVEPQQIIAMLAWQLHVLALVKVAQGRTTDEIAREAKLNPFVVRRSQKLAGRLSLSRLRELITMLRTYDERMKSEGIVPDEATRYVLLQLASA